MSSSRTAFAASTWTRTTRPSRVEAPSLRGFPQLTLPTTAATTAAEDHPRLLAVPFPADASGAQIATEVFVGTTLYSTDVAGDQLLPTDPNDRRTDLLESLNSVVLPPLEPRSYSADDVVTVTYEGSYAGDRSAGFLQNFGSKTADLNDNSLSFCNAGVYDHDAMAAYATEQLGVPADQAKAFAEAHAITTCSCSPRFRLSTISIGACWRTSEAAPARQDDLRRLQHVVWCARRHSPGDVARLQHHLRVQQPIADWAARRDDRDARRRQKLLPDRPSVSVAGGAPVGGHAHVIGFQARRRGRREQPLRAQLQPAEEMGQGARIRDREHGRKTWNHLPPGSTCRRNRRRRRERRGGTTADTRNDPAGPAGFCALVVPMRASLAVSTTRRPLIPKRSCRSASRCSSLTSRAAFTTA